MPLHTPLDRATTAQRIYIDCLVANARRLGTQGRASPRLAVNIATRRCRAQFRALNDIHRRWNESQGRGRRGLSRTDAGHLLDQAVAEVAAARGGRPPS